MNDTSPLTAALTRSAAACPQGVDKARYEEAKSDAKAFLAEWGVRAEELGWQPDDLFGLHERAPLVRYDHMGLIWLLHGRKVTAINPDSATIRSSSGGAVTFYPRR